MATALRRPARLDRMPAYLRVTSELDQAQALAAARAQLRARRYRVAEHDQGTSLAGEKGQLAETGNLAFHLSLLGVLVAVAAGSLFGYSGQAIVVVGGKDFANVLPRYSSFHGGTRVDEGDLPPFSLGLDDLRVRFEEQAVGFGAPRDFRADVRVQPEPGAAVHREVLKVNRPLDVGGARIFLVGNGYAIRVTVRDGTGAVAFAGAVPLIVQDGNYTSAGAIKVPDARPGQLGFRALLLPTAAAGDDGLPVSIFPDAKNPRLLVTAYTGDLGLDTGAPSSVYALDTKDLTQLKNGSRPLRAILAPGERMSLPDGLGTLDFEGVTRYAALDIRHDPSKGWALGSALLALAGLVGSLFVRRRRVWVRVLAAGPGGQTGSVLEVAGLARGEDPRLMAEIGALAAAVDPAAALQAADGENDDSRGESVRASAGTGKE